MQERMMLLYGDEGKGPKVQVLVQDETIWLTQKQIAELFEVQIPAVSKHLKNIFDEKELVKNEVVSKLEIAAIMSNRDRRVPVFCSNSLFLIQNSYLCK
mgnify:CR=1 FL=1